MSCCTGNEARPTDAMALHALVPRSSPPGFQAAPSPCSSRSRWSAYCLCSESSRSSCLLPPDPARTVPSAQNTLILVSPLTLGTFANIVSLRGLPSAEVNPLFFPQMDPAHFPSTTNNHLYTSVRWLVISLIESYRKSWLSSPFFLHLARIYVKHL